MIYLAADMKAIFLHYFENTILYIQITNSCLPTTEVVGAIIFGIINFICRVL